MVKLFSRKGREFYLFLYHSVGYWPSNVSLFELAFVHRSVQRDTHKTSEIEYIHNERLEYLGDGILGALVAEILYKNYPTLDEGKLTKIRSVLVSRKSLNALSLQLGFDKYIVSNSSNDDMKKSHIPGDVFEAFVAAVYLDGGFKRARSFVRKTVATDESISRALFVGDERINYKSKIIEWGQKRHSEIIFDTHYVNGNDGEFVSYLKVDGVVLAEGRGMQKKVAEQEASRIALDSCED